MSAIDNPETTAPAGEIYRAFWRWHFYEIGRAHV